MPRFYIKYDINRKKIVSITPRPPRKGVGYKIYTVEVDKPRIDIDEVYIDNDQVFFRSPEDVSIIKKNRRYHLKKQQIETIFNRYYPTFKIIKLLLIGPEEELEKAKQFLKDLYEELERNKADASFNNIISKYFGV